MNKIKYFTSSFLLFCFGHSQHFYSSVDAASAGAFLGGRMGTHAIHTNPALLGVKPGQITEVIPIDTFDISYRVMLATADSEDDLIEMEKK